MTNIILNHLAHLLGKPQQEINSKSFLNSLKCKETGLQSDDFKRYVTLVRIKEKEKKEQEHTRRQDRKDRTRRQDRKDRLIERSILSTQPSSSMQGWVDYDNCNLENLEEEGESLKP